VKSLSRGGIYPPRGPVSSCAVARDYLPSRFASLSQNLGQQSIHVPLTNIMIED
jgi:hypothetical protein